MCWPLSSAPAGAVAKSILRARPPKVRLASSRVTFAPFCTARTAAAQPAQPAPTMTMWGALFGVWRVVQCCAAAFAGLAWEGLVAGMGNVAGGLARQCAKGLYFPCQPEFAQRGEAGAAVEHLKTIGFDFA